MGDLTELVAAVLQRGAISASNHASCLKELSELLEDPSALFVTVFHDSLLVFLFSKQLKAEAATRLRELFAKFIGAPDRDSLAPELRYTLSKTISKCMSTLKKACQVQDNDIRACSMAMLAIISDLGSKWWPYVFRGILEPPVTSLIGSFSFSSRLLTLFFLLPIIFNSLNATGTL